MSIRILYHLFAQDQETLRTDPHESRGENNVLITVRYSTVGSLVSKTKFEKKK
jgi:hypothetical protein